MKHLKLFFACLLTTVLSIGHVWGEEVTVAWTASTGALGSQISSQGGTAEGTIATTSGTEISYNWNYTRTLVTLKSGKSDYITMSGSYMQCGSSNAGESVEFRTSNIPGTIKSVTVLLGSKDSRHTGSITVGGIDYEAGNIPAWSNSAGDVWEGTGTSSGEIVISIDCNEKKSPIYIASITVIYEEGDTPVTPTCATPTFSPSAGAVLSGTTVTLSTTTTGADIYYTKGASPADPTSASTKYTAPISITEATTIKAIAIKEGSNSSAVVSASYTVVEPLTTMDQIFSAATTAGGTATDVYITFNNWQISGVKNKNAFLTDGTKGAVIYSTSNSDFAENNVLSGTVACKVQLFKQFAEITSLTATSTGLTVSAGSALTPAVKTIDQLSAVNTGALVKVENLTYNGTNLSDGENTIVTYTTFYSASLENGKKYDITGIFQYYDGTKQLLPRSAADIEEIIEEGAPEAPTFSPAAGTYTEVKNVTISCATDGATIHYTTDGSTPTNTSAVYSSAISVGEDMTIKAIAIKNDKESSVATAAYVINLPADPETTYTWDLSTDSYVADPEPTADLIQWTSTYVTMKAEKNTGSTGVNNYIPPTRTSTRFYSGNKITFTPDNSKQITTIVITAATSGYATALKNATWTNATAAASETEVTITASGAGNVVCVLGSNTGVTSVTVNYEPYVAPTKYVVSITTPEHGSLAIAKGNNPIASGDEFVAGTELTVSTEAASGYNLNAIKVIETGSNPENDVTSTVLSGTTLTVPAHAITVSATFVETEAPVATLTLSENGVAAPFAGEHHQGDVVTLPLTSSVDCIKDFVGWSANASCTTAPEYAPGAEYTLASTEQTLYAVYATASGSSYVKTALASIASGSEVVVTEAKIINEVLNIWALSYNTTSKKTIASVVVEEEEIGVLSVAGLTNGFWILTKDGDKFSLTAKGTNDKLYCTNTNDGVRVGEEENNLYSINSNYMYNNGTTRYIGVQNATDWRCYTSINSTITGQTLAFYKKTPTYSDFATTCVVALADPVFTPEAGTYTEAKNIVITADEGTIYYTTDGTAPTSTSTEYTNPIVLNTNGTTTIKAIAISATSQSDVVSATYTINMPLSTIPAIFAAATSTQTEENIKMGNWVVSGLGTDGKTVYVTDGTNGFIIYNEEHGFEVGDILSGTITCELKKYKGAAELIGVTSSTAGLTVTKGGTITPAAVAPADLAGVNTGALISLSSWKYDGSNLTDGTTEIQPFTTIYDCSASFTTDNYYNVSGIYLQFDSKKEILPRSAADIEAVDLDDPELSYSPASVSLEVGQALSAPTFNNPHTLSPITYAVSGDAVATVTSAGVISLVENATGTAVITASFAGNASYAAGNATFTITVSEPVDAKNVVIIAEYDSKFYALTTNVSNKTAAAVVVEKDGDKIVVASAEDKAAIQWKKITDGENTTFQDADDNYLKGVSNGGDLTLVTTVCNWSWDGTNNCYAIGTRSFIYRENANGFKNYAISNAGTSDYSAIAEVIEIAPENIVISSKADPQLAYDPTSVELTIGDDFTPATLTYADGFDGLAAVTYESTNETLATVATDGTVSLASGKTGTATITATFVGNNNYLAGSASYTITVNAVPEPADVCDGADDFLDTEDTGNPTSYKDRSTPNGWSAVNAGYKVIDEQAYWMINGKTTAVGVITSPTLSDGIATLKFGYANTNSESNGVSVKIQIKQSGDIVKEYTLTKANSDVVQNTVYTETIEDINVVGDFQIVFTNLSPSNNTGNKDRVSIGRICWTSYSVPEEPEEPEQPIVLNYETVFNNREIGKYYTIWLPKKILGVRGAIFWNLAKRHTNGTTVYFEEAIASPDAPFAAGMPFIYLATSQTLEVAYANEAGVDTPIENGALRGTVATMDQDAINAVSAANDGSDIYIMYNNQLRKVNGQTGNSIGANRAYVVYNELQETTEAPAPAPGRRVVAVAMQEEVATGIVDMDAQVEGVQKILIDGQLFIIRNGNRYDMTGNLVK